MASIVKRGKKYTAVYYAPDEKGKLTQRWRATGETDWRKATRVAVELEEKAKESVTQGSRHCLEVVEEAAHLAGRGLLSPTAAQEFIAELYALSSGEELARHTQQFPL